MDQEMVLNVGKPKLILSQGLVGTDTALLWSGVSSWSLLSLACVFISVLQRNGASRTFLYLSALSGSPIAINT